MVTSRRFDFLSKLQKNGYITNRMFSTFIDPSGESIIKFGGYDDSGINPNGKI